MARAAAWCLPTLRRLRWLAPGLCAAGLRYPAAYSGFRVLVGV